MSSRQLQNATCVGECDTPGHILWLGRLNVCVRASLEQTRTDDSEAICPGTETTSSRAFYARNNKRRA